jgi:hypothetical protein
LALGENAPSSVHVGLAKRNIIGQVRGVRLDFRPHTRLGRRDDLHARFKSQWRAYPAQGLPSAGSPKIRLVSILGVSDLDLAAIGGVGTFVLAVVAVRQMNQGRRQTTAMEAQVDAIRDTAASELAAMREDINASVEQSKAVKEAARAQVQPIVFANVVQGVIRGRDEGDDVGEHEVGFPYALSNEGTGVALNITHGVEIAGIERAFGDGMECRSLRPGERLPPLSLEFSRRLVVVFNEDELPKTWSSESRTYWVRFENVFGDQFETRNPLDPHQTAAFMRMTELPMTERIHLSHEPSSLTPPAASPSAQFRHRWNAHTTIVAITAAAAVLGAAVGGFASYLGNRELQKSQDITAARGAGRVLQADFTRAASRIEVELSDHQFIAPDLQPLITIDAEDEKQIASNVSARTWDHVAAAKLVIQDEQESGANVGSPEVLAALHHQPVALQGARLHFEEGTLRALDGAVVALKELTGTVSAE